MCCQKDAYLSAQIAGARQTQTLAVEFRSVHCHSFNAAFIDTVRAPKAEKCVSDRTVQKEPHICDYNK